VLAISLDASGDIFIDGAGKAVIDHANVLDHSDDLAATRGRRVAFFHASTRSRLFNAVCWRWRIHPRPAHARFGVKTGNDDQRWPCPVYPPHLSHAWTMSAQGRFR
jgi:hypothetical protein